MNPITAKVSALDASAMTSSVLPKVSQALEGEIFVPRIRLQYYSWNTTSSFAIHKAMVFESAVEGESPYPLCQVRFPHQPTSNSSSNLSDTVRAYYDKVERQLLSLTGDDDDDREVEDGAVESALRLLHVFKALQVPPPELSWHGGDAVVMLWSMDNTTYAITVTDGEVGYVVRRNRKAIKMVDSLSIDAYRLLVQG